LKGRYLHSEGATGTQGYSHDPEVRSPD